MISNEICTLQDCLPQVLEKLKTYRQALPSDHDSILNILEAEKMNLAGWAEITYSRRPNLMKSYEESGQKPFIITDENRAFVGVVSELKAYLRGQLQTTYYTSDLRFAKDSGLRAKMKFRDLYAGVIQAVPGTLFTSVLQKNAAALSVLMSRKKDIFYHPICNYLSRSILTLPSLRFTSFGSKLKGLKIEVKPGQIVKDYLSKKIKLSEFCHFIDFEKDYFTILDGSKIRGVFALHAPQHRKILVEAKSPSIKRWMAAAQKVFGQDYANGIPWKYLTHFIVDDDLLDEPIIEFMGSYLMRKGHLRSGDLFLICHENQSPLQFKGWCPEFQTEGIFFEVSNKVNSSFGSKKFYLNPLYL